MRLLHGMVIGLTLALVVETVYAKVSQQEADQLGNSLTLFGAEQAGSADKVIPPYTGGLAVDTSPSGWKKESGRYIPGPYDDEKPLFSVTGSNFEKYKDHLTAGTIALLKKYPDYRLDVYPTHRSYADSSDFLANCKANALKATILPDENGVKDAHSCVPFPIPKSGAEVIWNTELAGNDGPAINSISSEWLIDADGGLTDLGHIHLIEVTPYEDAKADAVDDGYSVYRIIDSLGPPSQVGTKVLIKYAMDYDRDQQLSWIYTPGQRRTRLAPEFAYDTPIASIGGALNYDEQNMFNGSLDRYDWKLLGKKEMYVQYNADRVQYAPTDKLFDKNHLINADLSRWELHRVWVIEATLKNGKRHVEPRRVFYVDEDSWTIVASDAYDQAGNLFKVGYTPIVPAWDVASRVPSQIAYDLGRGTTAALSFDSRPTDRNLSDSKVNTSSFTPGALTSSGIR